MYLIEIDGREVGITFSACHMVPEHKKCERLHGHNYVVSVKIFAEKLDNYGFVIDFSIIKKVLRDVAKLFDHKIILPTLSKRYKIKKDGKNIYVKVNEKEYMFPEEDVIMVNIENPSAEGLASYMAEKISSKLKSYKNIKSVEVKIEELPGQSASYRVAL